MNGLACVLTIVLLLLVGVGIITVFNAALTTVGAHRLGTVDWKPQTYMLSAAAAARVEADRAQTSAGRWASDDTTEVIPLHPDQVLPPRELADAIVADAVAALPRHPADLVPMRDRALTDREEAAA